MKVSIVTACFNSAATIEATLASLSTQTWHDFEHVVVDGGSTDGTIERVQAWRGHPVRLLRGPDAGMYDAMNRGAAAATGDAIGFLNADDRYADSTALASIAGALADGEPDFVHGDLVFVDAADRRVLRYWKGTPFEPRRLRLGWLPAHPTLYVRRPVFEAVGAFSLDYGTAGDVDWMIRLLAGGARRSAYIPRVLVEMNAGGASNASLGSYVRASRQVWRSCARQGISPAPFFLGKTLRKLPQWWRRGVAP